MKLLFDLGNTRLKWALAAAGRLLHTGGADNAAGIPGELDDLSRAHGGEVESLLAVCVSPAAHWQRLIAWSHARGLPAPIRVRTAPRYGRLRCGYAEPDSLGADRWVAMIGATRAGGQAAIVADAGSALTLDAVTAGGRHLGGQILPGLAAMDGAFPAQAPGLTAARGARVTMFATDTATAMHSGVRLALTAAVERFAEQARLLCNDPELGITLTGGDAEALMPLLSSVHEHRRELVLEGLALLTEDHQGAQN